MKGIMLIEHFKKKENKWVITDKGVSFFVDISEKYFQKCEKEDSKYGWKTYLKTKDDIMVEYITIDKSETLRCKYTTIQVVNNNEYFKAFDKFYNIDDKTFKSLKRKAKEVCKYYLIDFDTETIFTNIGKLHGFYLLNCYGFKVIAFCKGHAILLTNKDIKEMEELEKGEGYDRIK